MWVDVSVVGGRGESGMRGWETWVRCEGCGWNVNVVGGRGERVCEEWVKEFVLSSAFLAWVCA